MKKAVFGTVIYRQAVPFFESFLKCLEKQTTKEFDLLLINDNLNQEDIHILEARLYEYDFENRYCIMQGENRTGYLSDFRVQMIREANKKSYDLLIIGDIDDLFKENRVEMIWKSFKRYSHALFFFNSLVDERGKTVLRELPKKIMDINAISQSNFLGMSNTAINLLEISAEFIESLYEGSCDVFDWYLYSRFLLWGGYGVQVEGTNTIYRIYDNNLAGIQGNSLKEIEREREVKIAHYQKLIPFSKLFYNYKKQLDNLIVDEAFYKSKCYNKNEQGYWWNNIRLEENDV